MDTGLCLILVNSFKYSLDYKYQNTYYLCLSDLQIILFKFLFLAITSIHAVDGTVTNGFIYYLTFRFPIDIT